MNPYDSYRQVDATTDIDNKPKLLIKVFELLLAKIDAVQVALKRNDFEKKYVELSKITTVIEVLAGSLDMECGEIPKNLLAIYKYLLKTLQDVHSTRDLNTIDECRAILATLKDGFSDAYNIERKTKTVSGDGLGIGVRHLSGTI
jgi:flagellar biosynthetic protein FliS